MVKQFLLNKKNQIINKFRKKTVDDINKLSEDINNSIKQGSLADAAKKYSEIEAVYKSLDNDSKNKIHAKCVEIHKKIEDIGSSSNSAINSDSSSPAEELDIGSQIDAAISSENKKEDSSGEIDIGSQIDAAISGENTKSDSAAQSSGEIDIGSQIDSAISGENNKENGVVLEEEDEYIKTFVPGFDDLIDKGIPKGSNVLVSGSAGSGKTTFSTQILMNNASKGKRCLFMSFEESEVRLKKHLRQYGFDPDALEKKGILMMKRYDPFMISRSIEALLAEARGELIIEIDKTKGLIPDNFNPEIIVIDSLSAISAAFAENESAYRIYIEQLFRSFEKLGMTSFLITERPEGDAGQSKVGVEEFLADGVINFYNMKRGNSRISATEVVKMRGTSHKKKIVPFNFIPEKGIEVYPLQEIFTE